MESRHGGSGNQTNRGKVQSKVCLRARVGLDPAFCFFSLFVPGRLAPCLTLSVTVCLSVSLPACLFVSAYLSLCSSVCLSACLPACLAGCLSVCLPVCLSVCLSVCLPVCLSVCVPVCLTACLPACLSLCTGKLPHRAPRLGEDATYLARALRSVRYPVRTRGEMNPKFIAMLILF